MEDQSLTYAKQNKKAFISRVLAGKEVRVKKVAIFMAGSPGAGKTEVALGLAELNQNLCIIDADAFRAQFPGYNGKNSSEFQRGAAKLVDLVFTETIKKGYSFLLDGTFALERAMENIERVMKRDYRISIFYVHQDPIVAWRFTKERELAEGRTVPKERFINAYFKARENILEVQNKFGDEIELHIVMKDYQNAISDIHYDAERIELIIPERYTKEELEVMLND